MRFPRTAPLLPVLHLSHVLGFTAPWEGTVNVLPQQGEVGLGGLRLSAGLDPRKRCRARVRGLLELADVDSFRLRIVEMLGINTSQGR